MSKNSKKIIWAEKISLTGILFFWIRSLFFDIRVNYSRFQKNTPASKLLVFLRKAAPGRVFNPVDFPPQTVDEKGFALIYKVDRELDTCIDEVLNKIIPREPVPFKQMLKSYLATNLQRKAIFITMAGREISGEKGSSGETNSIYLNSHPFNYLLSGFYRKRGLNIEYPRFSLTSIIFYLRPLGYLGFFLLCKFSGSRAKSNITGKRPAVWVEYYPSPWHSFWLKGIRNEFFDIISYLDRNDTPVTPESIKEITGYGSKWIDAHLSSLIRMSRLGVRGFGKLLRELFLINFSRPMWVKIFNFQYIFLRLIYESVFSRYKVKVLIQHQEASWKQQAQAMAVERAGGIMVGYHWSAYQYCRLPTHIFPQHVYFVWGKVMSELLKKKEDHPDYLLPSGIWILPDLRDDENKNIFDKNTDFVISVFDSTVEYGSFLPPASLSEFYSRILKVVKEHGRFGCIIKSKLPFYQTLSALPSGKDILKEVEILKGQKRLLIFDFNEYPLAAAAYSDLSVGYDINSACVVAAAVDNRKAIHWDSSGYRSHPFYKYPGQQVVFSNLDDIEEAILRASRGDKAVGDHSRWKKHFNYFEDNLAAKRMAGFIESYMKVSANNTDQESSLDFAAKKYLADNKVGSDFYQNEDLWEGSRLN